MYKRLTLWLCVFVLALSAQAYAKDTDEAAREAFTKLFPKVKVDAVTETEMKGVYEIVVGIDIAYFHPETGTLILGELRGKDGKMLTRERKDAISASKVKDLPLDKALKIGKGKNTVIEFTDPDCPFCRKLSEVLSKRDDITRYVFLFPLVQIHPKAMDKAKYILCAEDKAKALEEVMAGKHDDDKFEVCKDEAIEKKVTENLELGASIGISGTPYLVVNGEIVQGADIKRIETLLAGKEEKKEEKKDSSGEPKAEKTEEKK
ncbi:DsbC family protein [Candidatus Magnetobacterium casense]|uniref:DsbC family protein n=1 Tax=Candidatus Magnetobacterium casense TaxID=1455061 RepID=A0ABS6S093_9BACT|nr:DsbC family protein [Candidatus Magnetobacterium casensis]MBV6342269.1 DsbC family protein [Candidatus Magnetobacterium casensis]